MIRSGKVVSYEDGSIKVCFDRLSACGDCGMCGSGGRPDAIVSIKGEAAPGDLVDVEMPDAQVLKMSLITYLIPLIGLLLGLFVGTRVYPDREFMVLLCGLIGLGLTYQGVRMVDKKLGKKHLWQPRLLRVYQEEAADKPEQTEV